jgi:hypothetical protein
VIRTGKPGRPRTPQTIPPPDLLYATVHKTRRKGRVIKVEPRLQFGRQEQLAEALALSPVSHTVNTSFIERFNGIDRHRNSRKIRKTYRFSKDWDHHNATPISPRMPTTFAGRFIRYDNPRERENSSPEPRPWPPV